MVRERRLLVLVAVALFGMMAVPIQAQPPTDSGPWPGDPCDNPAPLDDIQMGQVNAVQQELWFVDEEPEKSRYTFVSVYGPVALEVLDSRHVGWGTYCWGEVCHALETSEGFVGAATCQVNPMTYWIRITYIPNEYGLSEFMIVRS